MTLDREELARLAADTGFRPATLEKAVRLGPLLDEIARHPFLGPKLALKGGTAIQLGLGSPRRLSVDLDLNYIGSERREDMLAERPEVEHEIQRLVRLGGYSVRRSRDEHAGRKFYLDYRSLAGSPDRIEVDLNFLYRVPLADPVERLLWQPGGFPRVRCRVVSDEELWAGKIGACLGRTLPRDLYDVAMLPERSPALVGSARFRALTIAISGVLDHPLHSYGRERLGRVTQDDIERTLRPMLSGDERPEAAVLAGRAWAVLEPMLALSPDEREFTDGLQRGDLRLELLFADDDPLRERLGRHPALRWKVENAHAHAHRASPHDEDRT